MNQFYYDAVTKMEEMGVNPFIYFSYNGTEIRPIDHVMCKDTEGDCMKWIN